MPASTAETINRIFDFIVPVTDAIWEFPTNLQGYAAIPVLGHITLPMFVLLATGLYFTIGTRAVQITHFATGIRALASRRLPTFGISPLASFLLSTAMRVGPGNIMGVTGAISVGGPGALFWMWVAAALGMATAFAEAVLAQLFKERRGQEYVGGLPFYAEQILGRRQWIGILLSGLFIVYALMNIPPQTFHMFTALGSAIDTATGQAHARNSAVYYGVGLALVVLVAAAAIGGVRHVTRVTDKCVPVMAVLYIGAALALLLLNLERLPGALQAVFSQALAPQALFGGTFGIALMQGVKRGLMSNEAGQGTITMAAAVADNHHPCEQGFLQSIGVFLDTMVICSLTGFLVILAQPWDGLDPAAWETLRASKLSVYMDAIVILTPGTAGDSAMKILMASCYFLFAFTTLVGMIIFAEIAAAAISPSRWLLYGLRSTSAFFLVPFGALCVIHGLELGNLWYIADLANVIMVFANVPILWIGSRQVFQALEHYRKTHGGQFRSADHGFETEIWK